MASVFSNDFQFEKSGDINTVYSFFYTYNYTGMQANSSYALPFAGFVFAPRLNDVSNVLSRKRIIWDFGDNTRAEAVTARHAYRYPGRYKVTCYLYDKDGNAYYDSYSQTVDVFNYITDSITLTGNYSVNTVLTSGRYTNPITVNRYTSFQAYENGIPRLTIIPYASGAVSYFNYFDNGINTNYYGHLFPYSSFYLLLTGASNVTEYVETASFETTSTPLYCRLSSNKIINCTKNDVGSFFCGTTGTRDVYFKSDLSATPVKLMFGYQPNTINFYNNTTTVGLSTTIIKNTDYNHLSITANGIDSEGTTTLTFPINKNKFSNTDISFVVRVKDSENYIIKDLPVLTNINLILTDGIQNYPAIFTPLNSQLSGLSIGGFYKGSCRLDTTSTLKNVFISAFTVVGNTPLTGISNMFDIYPEDGIYKIAKKGEDIDFTQKFKDISFQSLFLDKEVLYNQFIKNIFGTLSSDQTSIGKVTYEKIKNFVDNNAVSDYANVNKLLSIFTEYDIPNLRFDKFNYRFPAALARLIDLFSINKTKLFGTQNKFSDNFESYGYLNSDIYGYNLGEEITLATPISAGSDIVAFERFSGTYKRVNTLLPIKFYPPGIVTYQLIDYAPGWGWDLVLPPDGYGEKITNYYFFYRYIPKIDGTIEDGIINFDDINTTLQFTNSSYQDWSGKDGIIANLLANQLYKGLNLIK
jgi:hypothetical protein